tara:strand:+ start:48 stop:650 length:603 start_codon:yes stop_codon:yes gene_type:complete
MAVSKIQSESINLADNFAFTGTVTGAGSEGLVHLETQETSTAVADIKFGPDVFNTTYDRYRVFARMYPASDNVYAAFLFLNNSEADITGTNYYRYSINNGGTANSTFGYVSGVVGNVDVTEGGIMFFADIWLPHVGSTDYASMHFAQAFRVNTSQNMVNDSAVTILRYDNITTQPEGIKYYFSSGNISKALISVFAVTGG